MRRRERERVCIEADKSQERAEEWETVLKVSHKGGIHIPYRTWTLLQTSTLCPIATIMEAEEDDFFTTRWSEHSSGFLAVAFPGGAGKDDIDLHVDPQLKLETKLVQMALRLDCHKSMSAR